MKKLYIILLFFGQFAGAQTADELFQKANEQYKLEQYEEAIKTYERIESF
jgi:outer membrane protein assembly factor BamD (BamD/ComL family)